MSTAPYDPTATFPVGAPPGWRPDPARTDLERYWDGVHWTDQTRPLTGAPGAPGAPGAYEQARQAAGSGGRHGSRALGWVVQGSLGMTILLAAALFLYTIVVFNALSVWRLQPTDAAQREIDNLLLLSTLAGWADLGLRVLTGLLFLIWLGVRYTDTRVDPRVLRRSTAMAIICWFLPIVNLWWPAQTVKDLWHASRPDAPRLGGRLAFPQVFYVWWSAFLFAGSGSTVAMTVFAEPEFDEKFLVWATISTGVQQFATLVSAWALIVIIRQIEDHLVDTDPLSVYDSN